MTTPRLANAFRFRVTFIVSADADPAAPPLGTGGFAECTGLDVEMEVGEYAEGGRNDAVVQRAGRAKYSRLVLKRGMLHSPAGRVEPELWRWFADTVAGVRPIRRYDVLVEVLDERRETVASWKALRALTAKLVGPQLNARTGEVAMEELQLAHEGLRMVLA
ncbi:phage tail protein [Lentzea sp. BCCO 10_0856]|uniref:Phage tail protein n=1 Tax=Lentzea miocenica TaxID=3095431 RepID=A0ABU4SZN9_9PSEU|nr:phage tail protein [Lentzea sp. BCCO 10_0856]MDX8031387.1 phage tail protein [Lentzea sp. BCCO 10_0856]